MTKAADFLTLKARTKVGAGLYQYSYGRRGWITLMLKGTGADRGKWKYMVSRYNEFDTIEIDGKTSYFGKGPVERVAEESFYKSMKEALADAQYTLLTRDEKEAVDAHERAEAQRVLAAVEAQIAANDVIFDRLRAEGKIK